MNMIIAGCLLIVSASPLACPDPFIRGWNLCIDLFVWGLDLLIKVMQWLGI
jgi:hypothetical protein